MIANSPRLRHPREGGTTESGDLLIQTDSALSKLTLLKFNEARLIQLSNNLVLLLHLTYAKA